MPSQVYYSATARPSLPLHQHGATIHRTPAATCLGDPQRSQVAAPLLRAHLCALPAHGVVGERDAAAAAEEVLRHLAELRPDARAVLGVVEGAEGAAGQPEVQPFHPVVIITFTLSNQLCSEVRLI